MNNLEHCVCVERHDGQWTVVWYPFVGCDLDQTMIVYHAGPLTTASANRAYQYRRRFLATLRDHIAHAS